MDEVGGAEYVDILHIVAPGVVGGHVSAGEHLVILCVDSHLVKLFVYLFPALSGVICGEKYLFTVIPEKSYGIVGSRDKLGAPVYRSVKVK